MLFVHLNTVEFRKELRRYRKEAVVVAGRHEGSSFIHDTSQDSSKLRQRIRRLPKAIIIGSRKSGTRALLKFLEVNPTIKSANREVHFFDKATNYMKGLNWYKSIMPETSEHEITIEKSPSYFVTKGVPERIKAMNSSLKLILILRNPVERLISDFSQLVANKIHTPSKEDLETRMNSASYNLSNNETSLSDSSSVTNEILWKRAEKDFETYVLRPDGGVDEQRRAIRVGMYSVHLEKWMSIFPKDQIHFVNGDQMITEPHIELRKIEKFLGIAPVIQADHFVFNPLKGFYCLSTNTSSGSAGELSTNIIEVKCLSESKGRRHVKVRQELIEKLRNFYEPYNEYLNSMAGINFN